MKEPSFRGNRIKVTIGICVKNSEQTIEKAIRSVLNQDFPRKSMQLIIVDGNSHDRTLEILKANLENANTEAEIFSESSGLGVARQIVVDNAAGDFIIWVDADNILSNSYVRGQIDFMDNHPEVGIAAGRYGFCFGSGLAANLENIFYATDSVLDENGVPRRRNLAGTEGAIYRVKAVRQIGGFDTRMNGACEDYDVAYRMKQSGWGISYTKEILIESTRKSWSELWKQYVWYGRGGHFVFHKCPSAIKLWKMSPMAGFVVGVLSCPAAYLLFHKKIVFLLPFYNVYKMLAYFYGFFNAHLDEYGHFKTK